MLGGDKSAEHFKYSSLFELLLIAQNTIDRVGPILLIKRDPNISLVEISNLAQFDGHK